MNTRPRLVSSIPFWALLVVSLASLAYGLWIVLDKIGVMTATLVDQSATGVEVYAGQAWIVFGSAFVAAGVIGLVVTLAILTLQTLAPRPPVEVVETIAWTNEGPDVETPVRAAAPATASAPAAPVAAPAAPPAPAAPVAEPSTPVAEPSAPAAEPVAETPAAAAETPEDPAAR